MTCTSDRATLVAIAMTMPHPTVRCCTDTHERDVNLLWDPALRSHCPNSVSIPALHVPAWHNESQRTNAGLIDADNDLYKKV